MNRDIVSLRSTVYPSLMRSTLLRGTILAGLGAVLLLVSSILLTPDVLKIWGFPIFLASIVLISCGLLPYCKLRKLENSPRKLVIDEKGMMAFFIKGKPVFLLPASDVERVNYSEKRRMYGIAMTLKKPISSEVSHSLSRICENSRRRHGCDIFLPYFSQRSCAELSNFLS